MKTGPHRLSPRTASGYAINNSAARGVIYQSAFTKRSAAQIALYQFRRRTEQDADGCGEGCLEHALDDGSNGPAVSVTIEKLRRADATAGRKARRSGGPSDAATTASTLCRRSRAFEPFIFSLTATHRAFYEGVLPCGFGEPITCPEGVVLLCLEARARGRRSRFRGDHARRAHRRDLDLSKAPSER
jgi:hypothetical protein